MVAMSLASLLLGCVLSSGTVPTQARLNLPPIPREMRGVWVATVDNIDWPSKRTLTSHEQQLELLRILDTAAAMRLNTVIFQVRPSADALYNSPLEPWSEYLTNRQGAKPEPYYDPLAFAIFEAHKRGLELHCWFNPYRAFHPAQKGPVDSTHISKTNPDAVRQYGTYLWMDPGEKIIQERSLNVMLDVVKRYDVDGVHIDDYFYPYKINNQDFPDENSYAKYVAASGRLGRADWRRKNVDDFIEKLYTSIKQTKPWVKFGISPFGIYRPGIPEGIKAGVDQYADLYADALKWFVNGWCDYYTPQLYWPIAQTPQSYPVLLKWWASQNKKGRHLWPGNFTGRTNPNDGNWKAKEVLDQIAITRAQSGATGNVHFSMRAFMGNFNGITTALKKNSYREDALMPATPWLDSTPPSAPTLSQVNNDAGAQVFTWANTAQEPVMWWALWRRYGDTWIKSVEPGGEMTFTVDAKSGGTNLTAIAVAAVDRCGNLSPAATWQR